MFITWVKMESLASAIFQDATTLLHLPLLWPLTFCFQTSLASAVTCESTTHSEGRSPTPISAPAPRPTGTLPTRTPSWTAPVTEPKPYPEQCGGGRGGGHASAATPTDSQVSLNMRHPPVFWSLGNLIYPILCQFTQLQKWGRTNIFHTVIAAGSMMQ